MILFVERIFCASYFTQINSNSNRIEWRAEARRARKRNRKYADEAFTNSAALRFSRSDSIPNRPSRRTRAAERTEKRRAKEHKKEAERSEKKKRQRREADREASKSRAFELVDRHLRALLDLKDVTLALEHFEERIIYASVQVKVCVLCALVSGWRYRHRQVGRIA